MCCKGLGNLEYLLPQLFLPQIETLLSSKAGCGSRNHVSQNERKWLLSQINGKVPLRLELRSLDSESEVLTITPWNHNNLTCSPHCRFANPFFSFHHTLEFLPQVLFLVREDQSTITLQWEEKSCPHSSPSLCSFHQDRTSENGIKSTLKLRTCNCIRPPPKPPIPPMLLEFPTMT